MNLKIKENEINFKDYVNSFIVPRYQDVKNKKFLLSHFHRDHVCGLYYILEKFCDYFNVVYLPGVVLDKTGRAYLIEFSLYVSIFFNHNFGNCFVSTSALKIFSRLKNTIGVNKFFTLSKEDIFDVSGIYYKVLWPTSENNFNFSNIIIETINKIDLYIESTFKNSTVKRFFYLKEEFLSQYINCSNLCRISASHHYEDKIIECIEKLENLICEIEKLTYDMSKHPLSNKIKEILLSFDVIKSYSEDLNSQSIVFHNKDLLMTGDATNLVFNIIKDDLFESYNFFKAPHHGTSSGWSDVFKTISKKHIIISNGNYHAAGKVFDGYFEDDSIKHCTNPKVCDYYKENNDCCNRLKLCPDSKSFVFKCPSKGTTDGVSKCGVYIVSCYNDKGCMIK